MAVVLTKVVRAIFPHQFSLYIFECERPCNDICSCILSKEFTLPKRIFVAFVSLVFNSALLGSVSIRVIRGQDVVAAQVAPGPSVFIRG